MFDDSSAQNTSPCQSGALSLVQHLINCFVFVFFISRNCQAVNSSRDINLLCGQMIVNEELVHMHSLKLLII